MLYSYTVGLILPGSHESTQDQTLILLHAQKVTIHLEVGQVGTGQYDNQ